MNIHYNYLGSLVDDTFENNSCVCVEQNISNVNNASCAVVCVRFMGMKITFTQCRHGCCLKVLRLTLTSNFSLDLFFPHEDRGFAFG